MGLARRKGLLLQEEMSKGLLFVVASLEGLTSKPGLGVLPWGGGRIGTCWNDPEGAVAKQKPAASCSHTGTGRSLMLGCLWPPEQGGGSLQIPLLLPPSRGCSSQGKETLIS